jgi:hypothetical protein
MACPYLLDANPLASATVPPPDRIQSVPLRWSGLPKPTFCRQISSGSRQKVDFGATFVDELAG